MRPSPRPLRPAAACLALAALLLGCEHRPDFDSDKAQADLAAAFHRDLIAVQVLGDDRGTEPDTWIVDFRVEGFDPFLQAKFVGKEHRWQLDQVRERPSGSEETPWAEVGSMLGRFQGATIEHAAQTERTMRELATLIERYAVEHGNKFPETNLEGVRKLVVGASYVEESKWHHDVDGWGNPLAYHAAPQGQAYIVISPGADGRFNQAMETYFQNTDQGFEAYGGETNEPAKDFIIASGTLVQVFRHK